MSRPPKKKWIVDKRTDLVWFIGGALSSLLLLAAMLKSKQPVWIWFLWAMLLDTPHYFGTYVRTYFDPVTFAKRRRLWLSSLGILLVGPLVVAMCALLWRSGVVHWRRPFLWFTLAFNVWAYWHLVRQHVGIAALYRRRAGERDASDRTADDVLLYTVLIGAFILLVLGHPESRATLGLSSNNDRLGLLSRFVATAMAFATFVFAAWQWLRKRSGARLNTPKLFFLGLICVTYVFLCTFTPGYRLPLLVWTATITIAHDLQYFALGWFHHQNRRKHVAGGGVFAFVGRHWLFYGGCALLLGIVLRGLGSALDLFPGWPPVLFHSSGHILFESLTLRDLFLSVVLGVAMHHYFLDQLIWRPSRDPELARDLAL